MFFTGFADEASPDFATQIKATKELGWNNIEARNIGGKMLGTMNDEEFEKKFGMRSDKRKRQYNGMMRCTLFQFYKPRTEKKN